MTFSRQDFLTIALGLIATALVPLSIALAQRELDPATDWSIWWKATTAGMGAAVARYLTTVLNERKG